VSSDQVKPLLDVREEKQFLGDKRDVEAALIRARRFGQSSDYRDRGEANAGADALKALKDVKKAADEGRKKVKAPYEQTGKHIDGHYKEVLSPVDAAIAALDAKGVRFIQRARREREAEEKAERDRLHKEAEEKAAAAAEAARKAEAEQQNSEAQRAAAEAHSEAAKAAVAEPAQKVHPKQLRGDIAAFGTSTTIEWEVTDLSKLEPQHLTFNKKSIDAAAKAEKSLAKAQDRDVNLQAIPGVRIWLKETGVSRGPRS
jgi:hypothetical protein